MESHSPAQDDRVFRALMQRAAGLCVAMVLGIRARPAVGSEALHRKDQLCTLPLNRHKQLFGVAPMLSSLAATLITGSPDAILLADAQGRYVDAIPAALALLGYTRE